VSDNALPSGLSRPAQRALATAEITTVADLAARTESEVASLHGMGPTGIRLLADALAARGLTFADQPAT
jgi:hypothetical protein